MFLNYDVYDELPRRYRIVHNFGNIPVQKSHWVPIPATPLIDLSPYGTRYKGKTFRMLAKYEHKLSTAEYSKRVLVGTVASVCTLGGAVLLSEETPQLFCPKPHKNYVALYDSGTNIHPITKHITKTMQPDEFIKIYNSYGFINRPGITNGMLEKALLIGNLHVVNCLVDIFGDNLMHKKAALNEMITVAITLRYDKKLSERKSTAIISSLLKLGADVSDKFNPSASELHFSEWGYPFVRCDYHMPMTVLDAIHCRFKKGPPVFWESLQPLLRQFSDHGAKAYPGDTCCARKS